MYDSATHRSDQLIYTCMTYTGPGYRCIGVSKVLLSYTKEGIYDKRYHYIMLQYIVVFFLNVRVHIPIHLHVGSISNN